MSTTLGRLGASQTFIKDDDASDKVKGILSKQDELIDEKPQVISATYGGGSGNPTVTFTGLLANDTILSVVQRTVGSNTLPLLGYDTQAANALDLFW